jgi:hypothetical protein
MSFGFRVWQASGAFPRHYAGADSRGAADLSRLAEGHTHPGQGHPSGAPRMSLGLAVTAKSRTRPFPLYPAKRVAALSRRLQQAHIAAGAIAAEALIPRQTFRAAL